MLLLERYHQNSPAAMTATGMNGLKLGTRLQGAHGVKVGVSEKGVFVFSTDQGNIVY